MRVYEEGKPRKFRYAVCNRCGTRIEAKNGIFLTDMLHVEKIWGYFSTRDGKKQVWDICEKCYNEFTESFQYPLQEEEINEYL